MEFEWDEKKALANLLKHGVDFEDAIGIFEGSVLEVRSDRGSERRFKAMGEANGVVVTLIYTLRNDRRRIISARRASRHEQEAYRAAQPG